MKEKPILFSGPMAQAILDGRKTQTRRVINPQPQSGLFGDWSFFKSARSLYAAKTWANERAMRKFLPREYSPYGQPGDTLWVRETWNADVNYQSWKPSEIPHSAEIYYRADYGLESPVDGVRFLWRPSIYMPRWASRITLRVKGVRVERVQEITEEAAKAEGISPMTWISHPENAPAYRVMFAPLWNSIHGAGAWERNEWCWVVEFEKVEAGE